MNDIDIIYEQINTQGYYIFNNYISNIEEIENEFNIIINDQNNLFDLNTGKNKCLRTNLNSNYLNVKNFPNICNNFNTQFIINICKKFNINFNSDRDNKTTFIHQDYESLDTNNTYPHFDFDRKLKFYLCVSDVDTTNGCFKVFPNKLDMVLQLRNNSKRNNIFNKYHKLFNGIHIEINEMKPLIAKAGDLIIFDTNCIHAGGDHFELNKCRKIIRLHMCI